MAKYQIVSPHDPGQCQQMQDEILNQTPQLLEIAWFGCYSGDHTAYALVDAANETEARNMLPSSLRNSARVIKVDKLTAQQIRQSHQKAA